jgi:hypothetical protein
MNYKTYGDWLRDQPHLSLTKIANLCGRKSVQAHTKISKKTKNRLLASPRNWREVNLTDPRWCAPYEQQVLHTIGTLPHPNNLKRASANRFLEPFTFPKLPLLQMPIAWLPWLQHEAFLKSLATTPPKPSFKPSEGEIYTVFLPHPQYSVTFTGEILMSLVPLTREAHLYNPLGIPFDPHTQVDPALTLEHWFHIILQSAEILGIKKRCIFIEKTC